MLHHKGQKIMFRMPNANVNLTRAPLEHNKRTTRFRHNLKRKVDSARSVYSPKSKGKCRRKGSRKQNFLEQE